MKRIFWVAVVLLTLSMVGCSKPTIDASSDESMQSSVQKVRKRLSDAKQAEFDEAIQILAFSQIDLAAIIAGGASSVSVEAKMKGALNGKTAEEVIAQAAQVKAEHQAREREQALAEIQELEKKRIDAEKSREELRKFVVLRSRFHVEEERFMGKQPIIEITVKNGTNSPVSRAYFNGVIASPNRSIPWIKEDFNYSIKGGLEPGEEASWRLAPNMFSDWGSVNAPSDAVFTVTVEQLDGSDGESLFSTRDFDEGDAKRLEELKSKYGIK
ncbi:MAG: hypothetical protein RBQ99_07600 [Trichlorobacter sp.]|nr:hypothetical protein [Trichlorobacter sp.]